MTTWTNPARCQLHVWVSLSRTSLIFFPIDGDDWERKAATLEINSRDKQHHHSDHPPGTTTIMANDHDQNPDHINGPTDPDGPSVRRCNRNPTDLQLFIILLGEDPKEFPQGDYRDEYISFHLGEPPTKQMLQEEVGRRMQICDPGAIPPTGLTHHYNMSVSQSEKWLERNPILFDKEKPFFQEKLANFLERCEDIDVAMESNLSEPEQETSAIHELFFNGGYYDKEASMELDARNMHLEDTELCNLLKDMEGSDFSEPFSTANVDEEDATSMGSLTYENSRLFVEALASDGPSKTYYEEATSSSRLFLILLGESEDEFPGYLSAWQEQRKPTAKDFRAEVKRRCGLLPKGERVTPSQWNKKMLEDWLMKNPVLKEEEKPYFLFQLNDLLPPIRIIARGDGSPIMSQQTLVRLLLQKSLALTGAAGKGAMLTGSKVKNMMHRFVARKRGRCFARNALKSLRTTITGNHHGEEEEEDVLSDHIHAFRRDPYRMEGLLRDMEKIHHEPCDLMRGCDLIRRLAATDDDQEQHDADEESSSSSSMRVAIVKAGGIDVMRGLTQEEEPLRSKAYHVLEELSKLGNFQETAKKVGPKSARQLAMMRSKNEGRGLDDSSGSLHSLEREGNTRSMTFSRCPPSPFKEEEDS